LEEDTMAKALDGHWREEHLLVLAEAVALSEVTQLLVGAPELEGAGNDLGN
jgi:hypothetical protein